MRTSRVKLRFSDLIVEFVDRDCAIRQIEEIGERGTYPVYIIYGPEGCGKTALLRQAKVILEEEFSYSVIYVSPISREKEEILSYSLDIKDVVHEVLSAIPDSYARIADVILRIISLVIQRFTRPRIAVLMDDVFQAIGLNKVELYVKALLNLIEYPPKDYEKIAILVTSSEGITREKIGRHRWAHMYMMWNMCKEGFRELYDLLPYQKPEFEHVWRLAGGNPWILQELYRSGWDANKVVSYLIAYKDLHTFIADLSNEEKEILISSLEDPDTLMKHIRDAKRLIYKLTELNLIARVWDRVEYLWFDLPPPDRDSELGIGRYYAWQTPLHREAVRRALEQLGLT